MTWTILAPLGLLAILLLAAKTGRGQRSMATMAIVLLAVLIFVPPLFGATQGIENLEHGFGQIRDAIVGPPEPVPGAVG